MTEGKQSEEIRQLEKAMAALEAQRAILGDAVVDSALNSMQKQLTELEQKESGAKLPFKGERKLVTVMFADISGFTTLLESLDPEAVRELVNGCFDHLVPIIEKYEGTVEKFIGDEIMAIFGAPTAHENDPERALRTALEMIDELAVFSVKNNVKVSMRIGISTGMVIAGGIGSQGQLQYGVTGDTVNLAKRLEGRAPDGGILISHETYRHVRGVFTVQPQKSIQVKGKSKPVNTYLVRQAKPRSFRMETRGVEGIETRMVGREAELLTLQNIFRDAIEDNETRIVTVVGEAGLGKSRLLYEFEKWIELLPEEIWYFKGWASAGMQAMPYGVIRRMFANRFEILESDSGNTVMEKLRSGMAVALNFEQADLVGHLIGFDIPTSQALLDALEKESFKERALASLVDYLRVMANDPTVIFLEDFHLADDSSLNLIDHLAATLPESRLLVVCLARPALFERRPGWGEGRDAYIFQEIKPLSRRESRALVAEILQKVDQIPNELRDLVVNGAEGNPFYVEELIKMLIDDGVILGREGNWKIELERLAEARVPSTLAGVIQARLDSLPDEERSLLQRAAVVGRMFWDTAVAELAVDKSDMIDRREITPLLESVRRRELVFRREHSTFAETEEYIFNHSLLRDVTYETVLLKLRKVYHRQVAAWLEEVAGERLGEYLGLIAGHYELSGDQNKAVDFLLRAGDRARLAYAHQEAIDAYQGALAMLTAQGEHRLAARTLMKLGLVYHTAFDYSSSHQAYEQGFALWQQAEELQSINNVEPSPHALRTIQGAPYSLDPTMTDHSESSSLIIQLFSGLVEASSAMEIMPNVARSWEISDGGCRYQFHLRDDVCWSDGAPVTAGDFEFAWMRTLDPASGSPNASLLFDIKGARDFHRGEVSDRDTVGVRADNDLTLVVELERQTGYFLSLLACTATFPVPRHVVKKYGEEWTQVDKFVCNGAFTLKAWEQNESMVLKRNPEYNNPFRGNLKEVEISFGTDKATVFELYTSDKLDILGLGEIHPSEWDSARRRYAGEYVSAPESATHYVGFNVSLPPFDDPLVRQAFAHATDKVTLANQLLGGYLFPATGGYVPPGVPGHSPSIGLPYDPEKAQQLLAEAGYPGGEGFPQVAAWARERIRAQTISLQAQWKENLGIDIAWNLLPWSQYLAGIEEEPVHILQFGWVADYPDPDSFLRTSNMQQRTRWHDETYRELVEQARQVLDQKERLELYRRADKILVEAAAIIPLTYSWSHVLVKPWVDQFPALALNQWRWKNIIINTHSESYTLR
jgi:ABC-type oligopeptide transport system substrate-binding subunit/class 3 adenylate cyclase